MEAIMVGKRELRLALVGALAFLLLGSLQGCGTDTVSGPTDFRIEADVRDTLPSTQGGCIWLNGVWVCS